LHSAEICASTKNSAQLLLDGFFRQHGDVIHSTFMIQVFRTWRKKVGEERQAAQKIQRFWRRNSTTKPTTLPLVHIQDVGGNLPEPITEAKR